MSSEPMTIPRRRTLALLGGTALILAGGIATYGLVGRAAAYQETARWTDRQAVPTVALATLGHGDAVQTIDLPGSIQPFNKASIYARTNGYLKAWNVDIGAHVKAGAVLATIDTPDLDQQLDQAEADLASAKANGALAALTAKRWQALVASQSVAQQAVDEKTGDAAVKLAAVQAAEANVRRLDALESFKNVIAPFDGVVTARNTDIGALINAGAGGQELFAVSDLHRLRIYVRVPQALAANLKPGLKASFDLPQYPGESFSATLVTTSNAVTESSRSMLVELQTDNPDDRLWPGTYCEVHFQVPSDPNIHELQATALIPADQGMQVALLGADGKVELRPVQLGRDLGDKVEVVSGLSPGDRIIDNPPETLETGEVVQLADMPPPAQVASRAPSTESD